jgi:hypothetical protein
MRSSHHRNHHARRLLCLTALACFVVGGTAYACTRKAAVPQLQELPAESLAQPAENGAQQSLLTAAQAQALLDDPRMILVSRTHRITEDYPVETKECLSLCGGKGALLRAVLGGLRKALGRQLRQLRHRSLAGAGVGGAACYKAGQRRQAEQTPGVMVTVMGRTHGTYLLSQKKDKHPPPRADYPQKGAREDEDDSAGIRTPGAEGRAALAAFGRLPLGVLRGRRHLPAG